MMIKRLTIAVVVASAFYSGYWFVGASTVENAATTTAGDLRDAGWKISYDDLSVSGFPNLFETTFTAPRIAPPRGFPAWQSERLTVYALSYRPNEIIVLAPRDQQIDLFDQTVTLSATMMRASAKVSASPALPLDNIRFETGPFSASSSLGWELIFDSAVAGFRASGPAENAYDIYLTLDAPALDGLSAPGLALDDITIDTQAIFDAPLDRHATSPALLHLTLRNASIAQGDASIAASGALTFSADGLGNGEITVAVTEWATMVDILETAGVLTTTQATTYRGAGEALSGGEADFSAPIYVTDGIARFGFFTLGAVRVAPRG